MLILLSSKISACYNLCSCSKIRKFSEVEEFNEMNLSRLSGSLADLFIFMWPHFVVLLAKISLWIVGWSISHC